MKAKFVDIQKKSQTLPPATFSILTELFKNHNGCDMDFDICIISRKTLRSEDLAYDMISDDSDVYFFSSIHSTFPPIKRLADRLEEDGKEVLVGGMYPTLMPDHAIKNFSHIATGSAETFFWEIMRDMKRNDMKPVYFQDRDFRHTDFISLGSDGKSGKGKTIPVEISKGCTRGCSHCAQASFHRKKYVKRPVGEIIKEMEEREAERVHLISDNLTLDTNYAKRLFSDMSSLGLKWFGYVEIDAARDRELVKKIKQSGASTVFIGYDSLDSENLCSSKKTDKYLEWTKVFQDEGINIRPGFIIGFDTDDYRTEESISDFYDKAGFDGISLYVLTPIPGTPFYDNLLKEGRILDPSFQSPDLSEYDFGHAVFKPKGFGQKPENLQKVYENLRKRFFIPNHKIY